MKISSNYARWAALFAFLGLVSGAGAEAGNTKVVNYARPPTWVVAAPQATMGQSAPGAAFQFDYSDTQVRAAAGNSETYTDYRIKVLKPEALALGNLTLTWQPDGGSVTVHSLKIIRDGATIDVLDKTRFRVIEREQNLDQASLDGVLTAVLQVPGLRVGDTFEFSVTIAAHDKTLGDYAFGLGQLPTSGTNGAFRYRLIWPADEHLSWQTSKDLAPPIVHTENGISEINIELRDPSGSVPTDGAPMRYNIRRLIEYTGFASWDDLSRRMYPLFETASKLTATSPLQAEIDHIKAASADPVTRMQLALSLVEDRIRYVYVGLNGENYRPATADETWERRYGDCKSKTVLLLAILHGLDIQAEPVLVNLGGGDGINEWLASPLLFNHVLVRAQIGSRPYWMDGTRVGDSNLEQIPPPSFRWALPLRVAGAPIEEVKPQPLVNPESIENIDIDASAGFDVPAKVTFEQIFHNDQGRILSRQLEAMSPQDATQNLKSYANNGTWSDVDTVGWHYDEDKNVLILTFTGTWRLDAKGSKNDGRSYSLPGAGFYPPDERHRAKEQNQSAPWLTEKFPGFKCWTTTVHLPEPYKGWHWDYDAEPMNQRLAGTAYWRNSGLKGDIIRIVMSRNIYLPEITVAEANAVNDIIPSFNNNQSSVYESRERNQVSSSSLPFGDAANWDELSKSCRAR
ncbi:MAG TPA: DUF3857 domain-containing protein [Asticcacaulis sp.]|nr:DUF3857 domain-containing protein [Asticcacaulis sp.]